MPLLQHWPSVFLNVMRAVRFSRDPRKPPPEHPAFMLGKLARANCCHGGRSKPGSSLYSYHPTLMAAGWLSLTPIAIDKLRASKKASNKDVRALPSPPRLMSQLLP